MTGLNASDSEVCYVYGVTFEDTKLPDGLPGIGGRPVELVRDGRLGAIVTGLGAEERIGRREQLLAHSQVLDAVAEVAPVVPLRFGTMVTGRSEAAAQILDAAQDHLIGLLESVRGRSQFTLHARYEEDQVLREIVADDPQIAELSRQTRDAPDDTTLNARLRLGELVAAAFERKREADVPVVLGPIAEHAVAHSIRTGANSPDRLADAAFLVDDERRGEFDRAAEGVARALAGRVRLKLVGPTAPYDFVTEI
ncbi:GvpL/GvpF family gas vesicle protein [Kribbella hippodromi]|uniref:GvpL/GvpF family gas vesicle protein n=1 Tax=Kribbella hippodromi TaxID=434347 RepID=A0ABP4NSY3_9ACTN